MKSTKTGADRCRWRPLERRQVLGPNGPRVGDCGGWGRAGRVRREGMFVLAMICLNLWALAHLIRIKKSFFNGVDE